MRTLDPAPDGAIDPATGRPRFGSYRGGLGRVDLAPLDAGAWTRLTRRKRWMYVAIAGEDLYAAVCVVHAGYAANGWAFVYDAGARRLRIDRSILASPFACHVGDTAAEGRAARIAARDERIAITRAPGASAYAVEVRVKGLALDARLETSAAPPAITAIAPVAGGVVNTTEKRALLGVTGKAVIDGARRSLDGAVAGYDFTCGILARQTAWRWAFLLGRATGGERVALNLVEGFVGEAECAAWIDGELYPLAEGRFAFDAADPLRPWTVASGATELQFSPGGVHVERRNLGLVRSRFVHPIGEFTGAIVAGGRRYVLERALGVTEDQDVRW